MGVYHIINFLDILNICIFKDVIERLIDYTKEVSLREDRAMDASLIKQRASLLATDTSNDLSHLAILGQCRQEDKVIDLNGKMLLTLAGDAEGLDHTVLAVVKYYDAELGTEVGFDACEDGILAVDDG